MMNDDNNDCHLRCNMRIRERSVSRYEELGLVNVYQFLYQDVDDVDSDRLDSEHHSGCYT
jgi:hypothetical protein